MLEIQMENSHKCNNEFFCIYPWGNGNYFANFISFVYQSIICNFIQFPIYIISSYI